MEPNLLASLNNIEPLLRGLNVPPEQASKAAATALAVVQSEHWPKIVADMQKATA